MNNILPNRRSFRNEESWKPLGLRKDTASHVLRQLSEKGFLKKIATGFYEVSEKILDFMSNVFKVHKTSEGKRNKKNNTIIIKTKRNTKRGISPREVEICFSSG